MHFSWESTVIRHLKSQQSVQDLIGVYSEKIARLYGKGKPQFKIDNKKPNIYMATLQCPSASECK